MFDRVESLKQAIADNSIEKNTLRLMIDFYFTKAKLTQLEYDELLLALEPPQTPPEEPQV